jgi:hypothetical protein
MSSTDKLKNVKWRKIHAPTTWRPSDTGEELIGFYAGRTKRDGTFGQYDVVIIAVPYKGTFMISGTKLIQLFDSAMLTRGEAVRVRFLGRQDISTPDEKREMKLFELFVGELPIEMDLPVEEAQPS